MRRVNLGALLWSVFLSLTATGIIYLTRSGNLALFLHPRGWRLLILAALVLLLLSVASWQQARSAHSHTPIGWSHALFMLPLMLALCCPPQMLPTEVVIKKGLWGVLRGPAVSCTGNHDHEHRAVFAPGEPITINNDNFIATMEMLWYDTDNHLGRELEMLGFVYEDPVLGPNDFVIARLIMTCCAADAEVAGLLCRYARRDQLLAGQWITVRGIIGKMPFYNAAIHEVIEMPYLQVTEIALSQQPADQYIYP